MSNSLNQNTGADCEILSLAQLEAVSGGRIGGGIFGDKVVIIGCTTQPPFGGYPPGTVTWNPWIGQPYPTPIF
ncbi:hypothetical protein JQ597_08720 [Bradyrhizobium sp. AUGA SZCCT0177]|uniref:hypothetical protein n=1 Tax=Bradyrhizobium sp. AUGA SZCCT0177 TaxID=2807665 RepID=UPI001BA788EB|nr:hypothetical protein [Bradyrhizobium sp. AUGA SZCCT0177]MBR1282115.1 hypothetical protein [Bradyrhizobium sp. AUGA SZCCT0177]